MTTVPELLPLAQPELAPLKLWPASTPSTALVLVVPALGTPAGVYRRMAEALSARGVHAAVLELRGVGESPVRAGRRGGNWGYADLVDGEVDTALQVLATRFPGVRPVICGHSLGGHLALLHQARHPQHPIAGLVLMASGAPYFKAYPGISRWLTRGLGLFAGLSSRALGHFPGHWLGFGGRQGARLMREWSGFVRTGQPQVSGWAGPAHWRSALAALNLPILALNMPKDHYAPPGSTAHLIGLTATRAPVERLSADQVVPGHFAFLRKPDFVVGRIVDFLATQGVARTALG